MKNRVSHDARLVTVVVCTYNAEKQLQSCLESIVGQKESGVRLHVIDGRSTDATKEIIMSFGADIDFWISENDSGVYDAMNKATQSVESGWMLFLGADDRLLPGALARVINILKRAGDSDTLFYGDVYRPSLNRMYDGEFSKYKIMRRNICQQAILYPCAVLKKNRFDQNFPINADHILNIRIFFDGQIKKQYIPIGISYYEDMETGISRNRGDRGLLAMRRRMALELGGVIPFIFASAIDGKEWLRKKVFR